MFPIEPELPAGCEETLPELIALNQAVLDQLIEKVVSYGDDVPVPPDQEIELTRLMDLCERRIDEIMFRGKLIEKVRQDQGPQLP